MDTAVIAAIIGAGSAILGSIFGAFATYKAALIGFNQRRLKSELREALANLTVLRRLEDAYVNTIAQQSKTSAQAIKRKIYSDIRNAGKGFLTQNAEPARVQKRLTALAEAD